MSPSKGWWRLWIGREGRRTYRAGGHACHIAIRRRLPRHHQPSAKPTGSASRAPKQGEQVTNVVHSDAPAFRAARTMCARANSCAMAAATSGKRFGSTTVGALGQTMRTMAGMPSGSTNSILRRSWLTRRARGVMDDSSGLASEVSGFLGPSGGSSSWRAAYLLMLKMRLCVCRCVCKMLGIRRDER